MKKYFILTSVLALAACATGGISSVGEYDSKMTPVPRPGTVTDKAKASILKVTGVTGEIVTTTGGDFVTRAANNPRAAATGTEFTYNGKTYVSHKLDEVTFVAADEGFGGKLYFDINKDEKDGDIGDISGFNVVMPGQKEDEPMEFKRIAGDESKFSGTVEGDPNAILTYNSLGKDLGLTYSDFGDFTVNANGQTWKTVFMGGYDVDAVKITEAEMPTNTNVEFTGKVTGSVIAIKGGNGSGETLPLDTATNTDETRKLATLNFNDGTTTLTAKFDNWYDIKYIKDPTNVESITFSNYVDTTTNAKEEAVKEGTFKMINDTGDEFTITNQKYGDDGKQNSLNSDIRYFGDTGTPTEAVGLIQLRDSDKYNVNMSDYDDHQEVRMNIGFGGKAPAQ